MLTHLLFMIFVALAVYTQNLTGFALALVLLGLVGVVDLVPLPDVANAVTVIIIVNALVFFRCRRVSRIEPAIVPAVYASLVGTLMGMALLTYLAATAYQTLRAVLGISIIGCALLLWRNARPQRQISGAGYFALAGSVSGILGGLYATPGPPLVYAVYRQPWLLARMQEALIFSFAAASLLRLVVMASTGHFSAQAVQLAVEAVPVTLLVTAVSANRSPPISQATVKRVVCVLLIIAGLVMLKQTVPLPTGTLLS